MAELFLFIADAVAAMVLLLAVIGLVALVVFIVAIICKDLRDDWESEDDG